MRRAGGQGQRQRPARAALNGLAHLTTFNAAILAGHEKTVPQGQEGVVAALERLTKLREAILARRATADSTGKYGKVGQQRQEGFVSRSS